MELPYYQIPEPPEDYSPGNIMARMLDGLGYRYYWATFELTNDDLNYRPSVDSRTVQQTTEHIYGLSITILNTVNGKPNVRPPQSSEMKDFATLRKSTLDNIYRASQIVKGKGSSDLEGLDIIFQRGERTSSFPFWNLINGPIADALYHTGQVVAFRRASGNPLHPGVNVFTGITRK